MSRMDALDIKILESLQRKGRMSNAEMAERVNLSPSACHRRIQRLEDDGVIRDYVALLNPRAVDKPSTVFVEITLSGQADELLDAFDKLMEEGNLYGQAGIAYSKKGKGSIKDLQQKYKEVMKLYETYVKLAVKENLMRPTYSKPRKIRKGDRSNIPPPPPPSHVDGEIIEVPSSSAAPSILNGEIIEVPPSPPSPKSPEEHVMEMAKKDALFYFEGKKISSDKALEILKKSKKINLWTRHEGLKRPIVELSTESYFRPIPNN